MNGPINRVQHARKCNLHRSEYGAVQQMVVKVTLQFSIPVRCVVLIRKGFAFRRVNSKKGFIVNVPSPKWKPQ